MKGLKKNIDKSRNFNFENLIFSHFVRLNIAIKRIPHIFPWLCLRYLLHILSLIAYTFRENRDFVFITIVQFMMSSNIIRLFVHNTISLSSLCKLIWRHLTYKMPVRYILSSVWVRLSIFSQLYNIWGCVFSVCQSPLWWLRWYLLCLIIKIKSEVWTITHCLGLGHETMLCTICLYSYCSISEIANIIAVVCLSSPALKIII